MDVAGTTYPRPPKHDRATRSPTSRRTGFRCWSTAVPASGGRNSTHDAAKGENNDTGATSAPGVLGMWLAIGRTAHCLARWARITVGHLVDGESMTCLGSGMKQRPAGRILPADTRRCSARSATPQPPFIRRADNKVSFYRSTARHFHSVTPPWPQDLIQSRDRRCYRPYPRRAQRTFL